MISEGGGNPVDGGLQSRSQSEAQRLVGRVAQTARRLPGLTGGVRELEVPVHGLEQKRSHLKADRVETEQEPLQAFTSILVFSLCTYLLQREHAAEDAG